MSLVIKAGAYYRTQNDRRAFITSVDGSLFGGHLVTEFGYRLWRSNGMHTTDPNLNLVAGWDGPVAPDQCRSVEPVSWSPVRVVTRKEIVPGAYNRLEVFIIDVPHDRSVPSIGVQLLDRNGEQQDSGVFTAAELRAAIATLTEIADALDGQGVAS